MIGCYESHTCTLEFEDAATSFGRLLARFDPITLAEMDSVALLNRTDTKYLMRISQLHKALQHIGDQYQVLEVNKTRLNHYETLYFDTPNFELYHQHHNGLGSRYKIRAREYVDSDVAFFEIKHKTNQDRTEKSRVQTRRLITTIPGFMDTFVSANTPFDPKKLEPKLWNRFLRITLVSKHRAERLTLDVNLEFGWGDACIALPGVAIAEVKQKRFSTQSDFIQQMRHSGIRPHQFSKYCAGIYLLYGDVKINNFKPRMREVAKLIEEEYGIAS